VGQRAQCRWWRQGSASGSACCWTFYQGRSTNKFGILIGQIVAVDRTNLNVLMIASALVLLVLTLIYRPLLFASFDPAVAVARGLPVRLLALVFSVLVGVATAFGVQIVRSLLVVALMVTPAAAAARVTASPWKATVLAVVFAEIAALGGIVLSLAPGKPVSAFVTTISFAIYLGCRLVAVIRDRHRRVPAVKESSARPASPVPLG
jgi:zinc/manganese transport system permease protein